MQILFIRNQKINAFTVARSLEINSGFANVGISAAMTSREIDLSQEKNRLKADAHRFSITLIPSENEGFRLVQSAIWQRGW